MNTVELGIEYLFPYLKCFGIQFRRLSPIKKKKKKIRRLSNPSEYGKVK